jgi:ABC-type antimicrobial peptide transport system permease subunit
VPLLENLNTKNGREKLGFEESKLLNETHFVQFLMRKGDDASCINLNHIEKPEIVGVDPMEFGQRKSFSFEKLDGKVEKENAWMELEKNNDSLLIPAFADQTVITWGLLKKIGDTLTYTNEAGQDLKLLLVGGLNSSVFQGKILISKRHFQQQFPSVSGSKLCLIDAAENTEELSRVLNHQLQDYGVETQKTTERLNQFNSVTNTYLSVFMLLGALGILIATIGIGILIYRNMLDRRQEIAMMLALGFTKRQIFRLIFRENLVLVLLGMGIGLASALIGILPSLISVHFQISGWFLFLLLAFIVVNAMG